MPKVNTEILIWARKTAGLSQEEAAKKLGLSGLERLQALETGDRDPSRRQLSNMSDKYRRPLLTFYLPKPPQKSDKGQDFRTINIGQAVGSEAFLDALLRNIHARQGLVRAALEEAEEDDELSFVGSADISEGVDALALAMQTKLGFSADDFRQGKTVSEAFSMLRAATERAGIFVLLMGNLGTHHTDIDVGAFRGFSLADKVAPFIVINEKDSRAAWSFTLLHELAHIFLGQTGISGYDGEAKIEKFCDTAAARFLLPHDELVHLNIAAAKNLSDLIEKINPFAEDRKVSRKMVAYNLLRSNLIDAAQYRRLSSAFDADRRAQTKERSSGSGPDYYVVKRHRIGPGLVGLVKRMVAGGTLSSTKAGRVLGVKPTAVGLLVGNNNAARGS